MDVNQCKHEYSGSGCDHCGRAPDDPIHDVDPTPRTITQETRVNLNQKIRVYLTPKGVQRATFAMMQIRHDQTGRYIEQQIHQVMHEFGPTVGGPGFTTHIYTNVVLLPPDAPGIRKRFGERETKSAAEIVESAARALEKQGWDAREVAELREIAGQVDRWIL